MEENFDELNNNGDILDEETLRLMKDYDIDQETAEKVQDLMDSEGLDEDEAVELADEL